MFYGSVEREKGWKETPAWIPRLRVEGTLQKVMVEGPPGTGLSISSSVIPLSSPVYTCSSTSSFIAATSSIIELWRDHFQTTTFSQHEGFYVKIFGLDRQFVVNCTSFHGY